MKNGVKTYEGLAEFCLYGGVASSVCSDDAVVVLCYSVILPWGLKSIIHSSSVEFCLLRNCLFSLTSIKKGVVWFYIRKKEKGLETPRGKKKD